MTSILLQPLGPFLLAIAAGGLAGFVATTSRSLLAFAGIVVLTALVVGVLDLVANIRTEWPGSPADADPPAPLVGVAWELVGANLVVIGFVGALVYAALLLLPGVR